MFNPKITKGPWQIKDQFDSSIISIGPIDTHDYWLDDEEEDAKAICAVPELLEVYKEANDLIKTLGLFNSLSIKNEIRGTRQAIKKLEERHCDD